MGIGSSSESGMPRAEALQFVKNAVAQHKVLVFSKTTCPYCTKAKTALSSVMGNSNYEVIELNKSANGGAIQNALQEVTGGRTVPRVFVGGKFIGGGDDTAHLARNGDLKKMLQAAGAM